MAGGLRVAGVAGGPRAAGARVQRGSSGGWCSVEASEFNMWACLSWIMYRRTLGNLLCRGVASSGQRAVVVVFFTLAISWECPALCEDGSMNSPRDLLVASIRNGFGMSIDSGSVRTGGALACGESGALFDVEELLGVLIVSFLLHGSLASFLSGSVGCAGTAGRPRAALLGVVLPHRGCRLR